MNTSKHLIFLNGKDVTSDVKFCRYNSKTKKYDVAFQTGKTYSYNYMSLKWLREPEVLNPALVRISYRGRKLFKVQAIYVFHDGMSSYWRIRYMNNNEGVYLGSNLDVVYSCLGEKESKNCLSYLRQLAAINQLKTDEGELLLKKQYEKLDFVGVNTAMAVYLNPQKHKRRTYNKHNLIFPFGGNSSQFKAVKNALNNQISVIQGPPGTGKTQTILNIIANLLIEDKTAQVVSNNNSATENVMEKLASPKYNLDFIVAALGNNKNKEIFIQRQTGLYPDLSNWEMDTKRQLELRQRIERRVHELSSIFAKQERLAKIGNELNSLILEMQYFEQYCSESGVIYSDIKPRCGMKSKKLMRLWQECYKFSENDRPITFWFKFKSTFFYGISDWKFYENTFPAIIAHFQGMFYQSMRKELSSEISTLKKDLAETDAKWKMDELTSWSMDYLRAKLFERYGKKYSRMLFTKDDFWKRPDDIVNEYPIILSTTFSSISCLKDMTYDYLIMDEASQVDIATGALSLSSARNAVIVGDCNQLPNVVTDEMKKQSDAIFSSYKLSQGYSFSENSFLESVCNIIADVPQTLLREHYRCHPKIIDFCNQKYYNNELVIMTEDDGEADTLSVYNTTSGNHRRDRMNQRQIDVTIKEVLPKLNSSKVGDVGIIAPYRDQVVAISKKLNNSEIEVDTVHKFQGREKDTIVLTTVDDVVTDFSDDPNLLNVAISRAKKRFCLVVSGNNQPVDSNIGDLISYIEYNNFQVVESEIYSVFDMLYQHYTDARIAFLRKHSRVSIYDSENLMYGAIVDILKSRPQLSLNVICHQQLNMLIRDPKHLNDKECRYAMNTATHVDFLIYNRITKRSVLAIEVDGFHYHKPDTRQYERDLMKDRILALYGIPLLRFPTNGSKEIEQIKQALDEYEKSR